MATVKLFGLVTPMYVGAQAPNQLFMIDVADGSTLTWSDYSIVLVDTTMNTETAIDGTIQSDGSFLIPETVIPKGTETAFYLRITSHATPSITFNSNLSPFVEIQ